MKKTLLALLMGATFGLQAQFVSKFQNGMDHNYYSIESLDDDVVMAGTVFPSQSLTNTDIHAQRLDASGNVVWEIYQDIGSDERCMGMTIQENWIILTGTLIENQQNKVFVMRLDANNGTLVDFVKLDPAGTAYPDQLGQDVIYSDVADRYFIAGWGKDGFSSGGVLICLDANLGHLWTRELTGATLSTVVDMPGHGVFVMGSNTVAAAFDYNGGAMWQIISYVGAGQAAVYDAPNDRILLVTEEAVAEISNASGGATMTQANWLSYTGPFTGPYDIGELLDIELNANTGNLAVLGLLNYDGVIGYHDYPMMIMLDPNNLSVQNTTMVRTFNHLFISHDSPFFSVYNNSVFNNNSLTTVGDDFAYVSYESISITNNTYNVNATRTDPNGKVSVDCSDAINIDDTPINLHFSNSVSVNGVAHNEVPMASSEFVEPHDFMRGCFDFAPCDVNASSLQIDQMLGCSIAQYSVTASAGTGTVISQYAWDWDDGSPITTTTGPTATHQFTGTSSIGPCTHNVCVTVFGIGSDGSSCQQQFCLVMGSITPNTACGICQRKGFDIEDGVEGSTEVVEISIVPNPAADLFAIRGITGNTNYTIMDLTGRVVFSGTTVDNSSIDVSGLKQGVYLVKAQDELGQGITEKLVVK